MFLHEPLPSLFQRNPSIESSRFKMSQHLAVPKYAFSSNILIIAFHKIPPQSSEVVHCIFQWSKSSDIIVCVAPPPHVSFPIHIYKCKNASPSRSGFLLRISLAGTVAFIAGTTRPHRITMRHFFNGFRITS